MKDNHELDCSDSGFRAYVSRKPELQAYFESARKRKIHKEVIQFESPMKFLDETHAYQGQLNYQELQQFVMKLCNRIITSYHQGTWAILILGVAKERNLLSALPSE